MAESIPVALQPPVAVALAKLVKAFPGPGALPGGVWMEPKWDGFIHWTLSSIGAGAGRHASRLRRLRAGCWPSRPLRHGDVSSSERRKVLVVGNVRSRAEL